LLKRQKSRRKLVTCIFNIKVPTAIGKLPINLQPFKTYSFQIEIKTNIKIIQHDVLVVTSNTDISLAVLPALCYYKLYFYTKSYAYT